MSTENFLQEGYEVPTSGGGFTKMENGENRFRILSSPLLLWVEWRDGKPFRHAYTGPDSRPAKGDGAKDSVKHAWGLKVWNYGTKKIEVFELDKQDIIGSLTSYAKNPKWGHPKQYDVVITKTGSGMDTEYSLVVEPKEEPTQEVYDAYTETPIDLSKLLTNESPFMPNTGGEEATKPAKETAKVITAENWTKGDPIPEGYEAEGDAIAKKKRPF
jgi:hypothetical protein